MLKLKHKQLKVWQQGVELVKRVYQVTEAFPPRERYGLTAQMRRASISVPSNIAEGAARFSARERIRFFEIARSSLVEIDTQLEIATALRFCSTKDCATLSEPLNHLFAMLSRLMVKTRQT
jgi:four helix bundle protein